ncbi:somatostatin receptor type 2-like [Patiria miniata]|uniref:G-protein coupled receptors family 1 profile domain-containing protein n=1 Tax=Patiria miniata TaxID=46514 RepID=A0A914BDH4_PATMI|nr:somatostatin receptor type 2-like [Patiria miniata]
MLGENAFTDPATYSAVPGMYSLLTSTPIPGSMDGLIGNGSFTASYGDGNGTGNVNDDPAEQVHNLVFQRYVIPVFYSLVFLTGIIGNGLVIIVLLKYPNMRTIPNVYILSLALVDFMFVLCLPLQGYQIFANNWPFGYVICKFAGIVDGMNQFASINILTIMSADRYVAVVYPLSSMRYRTKKTARIACGIVFAVSFLLSTPTWHFTTTTSFPAANVTYCSVQGAEWDPEGFFYVMYMFLVGFLIPLVVIIMCYSTLLLKILGSKLRIRSDGTGTAQRASKRVLILTVSVIVAFVACWLPFNVVSLLHHFTPVQTHALAMAFNITSCWCYTNSGFNPIIYTFIGENFKKNLMNMCPCCTSPEDTKLDRYRSNRESSTYIRGGTLRLHSVQHDTASPTTPCTATTDDTSFMDSPPNIYVQTYTFANNNSHNACNKE